MLLVIVQLSRGGGGGGGEEEKCYRGAELSVKLSHWISGSLALCRRADGGDCPVEQFYDIQLTRLEGGDGRSWYITSSPGWSLTNKRFPRAEAYQGAFYYESLPGETGVRRGVYLYPDWSSCVSGRFCLPCVMCVMCHVSCFM